MTGETSHSVLRQLCRAALGSGDIVLTDGQLLERFLDQRDEMAFELLLRRHGPMILGVCRRMLGNAADAEDAFQAVFLVLLRKADSLRTRRTVGDFLHGVAYHTALKARAASVKRRLKESRAQPARPSAVLDDLTDVLPLLDQELARLPARYREAVVLCELQGRGRKEAARLLGIPEGTLSSRLAAARKMLARRLSRRGLPLLLAPATAVVCVPSALAARTLNMAIGGASASVAALAEGVTKLMLLLKLKILGVLLAVGLVAGTATVLHLGPAGKESIAAAEEPPAEANKKPDTEPNSVKPEDAAYRAALLAALQLFAFKGEADHVKAILARHPELKDASITERDKRMLRWKVTFQTDRGEDYLKQLRSLGAILAVPTGWDGKSYKVIRDLSGRREPRLLDEDIAMIRSIFWIDDRPGSVCSLLEALHLKLGPSHVVAIMPPELEKRLFELEKEKAGGVPEDQIRQTLFNMVPDGRGGYEPKVISVE